MRIVDCALAYARLGWPVVPCRGKIPCESWSLPVEKKALNDGPHGYNNASTDEGLIRHWWRRFPDANIGLATGHAFFALDVDAGSGKESLGALIDRFGDLPETLTQITGGGGGHLLFKAAPGLRNWSSRFCIDEKYVEMPGLDIRTAGTGIIAAPSMHKSGKLYRWKKGHGPKAMLKGEIELAEAPEWLIRIATPPAENVVHFQPLTGARGNTQGNPTRYGEAALVRACEAVSVAMPGTQEATLHREAYSIGGLVAAGELGDGGERTAYNALVDAALKMQAGDPRWPWTPRMVSEKVRMSMAKGMNRPRLPAEGRR